MGLCETTEVEAEASAVEGEFERCDSGFARVVCGDPPSPVSDPYQ